MYFSHQSMMLHFFKANSAAIVSVAMLEGLVY